MSVIGLVILLGWVWVYYDLNYFNHLPSMLGGMTVFTLVIAGLGGMLIRRLDQESDVIAAIANREAKLSAIIGATAEGYWELDEKQITAAVNDSLCRMLGYAREEMLGRSPLDFADVEDRGNFAEQIDKIPITEHRSYEVILKHKNGSQIFCRFEATTLRNREGTLIGSVSFTTDITGLKKSENRLRESEAALTGHLAFQRILLNAIPVPVFSKDPSGRYTLCNKAFCDMIGKKQEEVEGKSVFDLYPYETAEIYHSADSALIATGGEQVYEAPVNHADGSVHNVILYKSVFTVEGASGIVGAILDITERKAMETMLANKSALLLATIDTIPGGVSVFDANLNLVAWNAKFFEMLEFPRSLSVVGTPFSALIRYNAERGEYGPGNIDKLIEDRMAIARRFEPHRFERTRPDGKVLDIRGTPMQSGGFVTIYLDITELKARERQLTEQTAVMRTLIENMDQGITLVDHNLKLATCNERFLELLELPAELGKPGTPFAELVRYNAMRGEYGECDIEKITRERMEQAKQFTPHRVERTRPNGKVLEIRGLPVPGGGFVTTYTDITERRVSSSKLEELAAELKRSNAELEEFAYVASHDLQEPLRMVSMYVQLLSRRYSGKLDKEAEEFIHFAKDGAQRMSRLITDLLDYSRLGKRGQPFAPVDLDDAHKQAMENLRLVIADNKAEIICESLPRVMGDAGQLVRLLQNLIGNALKYRRSDIAPKISILNKKIADKWHVTVSDNGIGIDSAHYERIFQVFQRLHPHGSYEGTGIGLAICKKIVERHGGEIWVESTPGKGSAFNFSIPAIPD
jgi:PAS domain S-box-containing protein